MTSGHPWHPTPIVAVCTDYFEGKIGDYNGPPPDKDDKRILEMLNAGPSLIAQKRQEREDRLAVGGELYDAFKKNIGIAQYANPV
jgi:hypothetical protein